MADQIISRLLLGLDTREFRNGIQNLDRELKGFSANLSNLGGLIGATFAVGVLQQFGAEAIKLGDQLTAAQQGFKRFGDAADLEALREATKGTVSDVKLLQGAIQAGNFGIPVQELGQLFEFARRRAKETGQEVDYLVNSIVTGIGRKSPLILDNLGISATMLREKLHGVSVEAASIADVTKAVAAIASEQLGNMGADVESATDKIVKFNASWENFTAIFGQSLGPMASTSLDAVARVLDHLQKKQELLLSVFSGFKNAALGAFGISTGATDSLIAPVKKVTEAITELTEEQKKAFEEAAKKAHEYKIALLDLADGTRDAKAGIAEFVNELNEVNKFSFDDWAGDSIEAFDDLEREIEELGETNKEVFVDIAKQYRELNDVISIVASTIGDVLNQAFTAALVNGEDFFKVLLKGLSDLIKKLIATAIAAAAVAAALMALGIAPAGASFGQVFKVVGGQMGLPGLGGLSFGATGSSPLDGGRSVLRGNDIFMSNTRTGQSLGRIGG